MKSNLTQLIKNYEKDIISEWHLVMGNRKVDFNTTITHAGICAERICRAVYIRKFGKEAEKSKGFYDLINLFYKEKIFDEQIKLHMNTVRKPRNNSIRISVHFKRSFVELMRIHLTQIIKWYQYYSKKSLRGLNISKYERGFRRSPVKALTEIQSEGVITEKDILKQMESKKLERIQEKKIKKNPVYSCLIIDESISMMPYRDQVISAHVDALAAVRGSAVCKRDHFYMSQYIFNKESKMLNSLTLMKSDGRDKIVELNRDNYQPNSLTALYDTLYEAIMELHVEANSFKNEHQGYVPQIVIGVITDGEDTSSLKNAADVKRLMESLYAKRLIESAIVIGWAHKGSPLDKNLNKVRKEIGFDQYANVDKNDPSAIREAFKLWSSLSTRS